MAHKNGADLYLDLLSKTLTFSLWPEPPLPLTRANELRAPLKRMSIAAIAYLLRPANLSLVKNVQVSSEIRQNGLDQPGLAHTMIGTKRLANIRSCAEAVLHDGVPGHFIETGVWRGGACIFMRAILAAYRVKDRKVYVADSFEGLPPPDEANYPADAGDELYRHKFLKVSIDEVKKNFEKYGLLDDQVVFLKGFFADTLPTADIGAVALMRLDGDMYGSTMDALVNLYPKLQPGGFCIIDDYYALQGARRAVHDFRASRSIAAPIQEIDGTGVFWRK